MRRTLLGWMMAGLLLAGSAQAGTWDHDRRGFFIGFGGGAGGARETYKVSAGDAEGGGGIGNFRIGGAFNRTIALGLETTGFIRKDKGAGGVELERTASIAAIAATWFPAQNGFYLRGGVGVAQVTAEVEAGALVVKGEENGAGGFIALGNEWRLTRKFALAPQIQFTHCAFDDTVVDTVGWWGLSAQLNWWWS